MTECGHSVYDEINRNNWNIPQEISIDESLQKVDEWIEYYDSDLTGQSVHDIENELGLKWLKDLG